MGIGHIGIILIIISVSLITIPVFAESDVVIYEVEPFDYDEGNAWVKLFNPSDNPVSLSGWEIATTKNLKKYTLSGNIEACDFKKITLQSTFDIDFELYYIGSVVLYDNNGEIVDYTPSIEFGWVNPDVSFDCTPPLPVKQEPVYEEPIVPEPVGMGFYSNELYEFSFEIPMDWRYQENFPASDGSVIQLITYPEGFNPLLNIDTPHIVVVFENIPESKVSRLSGQTLEKYHIEQIRSEKFAGGKIISTDAQDKPWGWEISTEFIFTQSFGLSGEQFHTEQRAFHFKDREYYTVAYFSTDDYYDTYHPVFEDVINSLVIKGVVVPEFQEIALMVLGGSIALVVIFARKFTKFVTKSENS